MFKSKERKAAEGMKKMLTNICDLYEHRSHAADISTIIEGTRFELNIVLDYPDEKLLDELISVMEKMQEDDLAEEMTEEEANAMAVAKETHSRTEGN